MRSLKFLYILAIGLTLLNNYSDFVKILSMTIQDYCDRYEDYGSRWVMGLDFEYGKDSWRYSMTEEEKFALPI